MLSTVNAFSGSNVVLLLLFFFDFVVEFTGKYTFKHIEAFFTFCEIMIENKKNEYLYLNCKFYALISWRKRLSISLNNRCYRNSPPSKSLYSQ